MTQSGGYWVERRENIPKRPQLTIDYHHRGIFPIPVLIARSLAQITSYKQRTEHLFVLEVYQRFLFGVLYPVIFYGVTTMYSLYSTA